MFGSWECAGSADKVGDRNRCQCPLFLLTASLVPGLVARPTGRRGHCLSAHEARVYRSPQPTPSPPLFITQDQAHRSQWVPKVKKDISDGHRVGLNYTLSVTDD
ncbi:hypothetical protein NDU88_003736 [Pleurodeles waltl]|uniref:Uncharacterized protein n=1 Tax=Pleurodeles waltl TaxID=8319 RepID=A0AAV7UZA6_PLEWA|nr:hypothetical protein NDU88_003736 [Pleurodeles waltl]